MGQLVAMLPHTVGDVGCQDSKDHQRDNLEGKTGLD